MCIAELVGEEDRAFQEELNIRLSQTGKVHADMEVFAARDALFDRLVAAVKYYFPLDAPRDFNQLSVWCDTLNLLAEAEPIVNPVKP